MATKKGGYLIIDVLALTYAIALESLKCDKPLLIINDSTNTPYYADGVEIDGSENVIIHKGGRTITIEPDGDVVASGTIVPSGSTIYVTHFCGSKDSAQNIGVFSGTIISSSAIESKSDLKTYITTNGVNDLNSRKSIGASGWAKDQDESVSGTICDLYVSSDKLYAVVDGGGAYDNVDVDSFNYTFNTIQL